MSRARTAPLELEGVVVQATLDADGADATDEAADATDRSSTRSSARPTRAVGALAPPTRLNRKGLAALATFVIQHALGAVLVRYTMTRLDKQYDASVAVLMQELVVKLPLSLLFLSVEQGGALSMARHVVRDARENSVVWIKMLVPSIVYTVQMNALYIGYGNVEAAIGQTIYQTKIIFTAFCTRTILRRMLNPNQWISLLLLMLGVVVVQSTEQAHKSTGRAGQNPLMGSVALAVAAFCSAFASVYFESIVKGEQRPSLWLLNIQLALFGSMVALAGVLANGRGSWFDGFTPLVWFSIAWQAGGGLVVALTIKHADNVLRCFAQAGAIVVVAVVSAMFFEFVITGPFFFGTLLVILSMFLYGSKHKTPRELMDRARACAFRLRGMRQLEDGSGQPEPSEQQEKRKAVSLVLVVAIIATVAVGGAGMMRASATHLNVEAGLGENRSMEFNQSWPGNSSVELPQDPQHPQTPPPQAPQPPLQGLPALPPPASPVAPSPWPPMPPASPDPYEPAGGCEWEMNEWCRKVSHSHCGLGNSDPSRLLARYGVGAYGSSEEWRCYQPVCVQGGVAAIPGCHSYCTRNEQLLQVLSICHEGRYTLAPRSAPPTVKRLMLHLDRDGWKLGRFQRSVRDIGMHYDDLGITLRPGVIVRDHPELQQWALDEGLMAPPSVPGNLGNIGSALAHLTLWRDIALAPDNETYMIYEDNALQTMQSEHAIQYYSSLEFDFFNFRVIRAQGSPTNEDGVLRMPNNHFIEPPPHLLWFFRPMPNLWLSSYMITPRGAREMLAQFRNIRADLSDLPVDQVAVMALYRSPTARAYVVNHDRFFGHLETHSDTRSQLNSGR
jgi:UDP-sugar transporter A1/2/3